MAAGTYFYWLEDVSLSGAVTPHEPVSVTYVGPTAVGLNAFGATSAAAVPALGGLVAVALARRWARARRGRVAATEVTVGTCERGNVAEARSAQRSSASLCPACLCAFQNEDPTQHFTPWRGLSGVLIITPESERRGELPCWKQLWIIASKSHRYRGGKPRIAGHRITVQDVVIWHEWLGRSADEISAEYGLDLVDVYAALANYYDHQPEMDQAIREQRVSSPRSSSARLPSWPRASVTAADG